MIVEIRTKAEILFLSHVSSLEVILIELYDVFSGEGNAGFLEVGSFTSVADSSYSVLGWNHPGFGASTGMPYPINDGAAILSVIGT